MTNSNRGILSTVISFIMGVLVGFVLLIGGIAGGAFWAYKNLKLAQVNSWAKQDIFGDAYEGMTVEEFVAEVMNMAKNTDTITLAKLEDIFAIGSKLISDKFPDDIIKVPLSDGAPLLEIDLSDIRNMPVTQYTNNLSDIVVFTATLESLSVLGVDLPDFPLITGGGASPVDVYTQATEDTAPFTVKKVFKNYALSSFYEFDSVNGSYTAFTGDLSNPGKVLYIKTDGINELPLIEGINALGNELDFNTMTLSDLEVKLGITLKDDEGNYHPVINSLLPVKINDLGKQVDSSIQDLTLGELIVINESDENKSHSVLIALKDTKIKNLSSEMNLLKISQLVTVTSSSPKMLQALQTSTLSSLSEDVKNLALADVMDLDSDKAGPLKYVSHFRNSNGEFLYYTDETKTDTTTTITDYPVPTKITEAGSQINLLKVGEILDIDGITNPSDLLLSIKDNSIKELPNRLETLTLQEAFYKSIYNLDDTTTKKVQVMTLDDTGKAWPKVFSDDDYEAYYFRRFFLDEDGTQPVTDVFFKTTKTFNTKYSDTPLYTDPVRTGAWRYLICTKAKGTEGYVDKPIALARLNNHMDDIALNIKSSTLFEFKENELIDAEPPVLATIIGGRELGEFTIDEIIAYIALPPAP